MVKLYKNKSPNFRRITLLFIVQIVLGVLPVALFLVYAFYIQRSERLSPYSVSIGVVFAGIMTLSLLGYSFSTKKYNILLSGYRGERILIKIAKKLTGDYTVFTNLPIRYKKNRSEIDLVLVGNKGLLIIEVKNHSGVLIGSDYDESWTHRKYYRRGKTTEFRMDNPFNQIKRQREILKSILRSNGIDVWIDSILFFSGNLSLRLKTEGKIPVASSENELLSLISEYQSKHPMTSDQNKETVRVLKGIITG